MPGLIDPHTHFALSGGYLALLYVGPIDSPSPTGTNPGLRSMAEVSAALTAAHRAEPDISKPLIAWGLEPASQGSHLDIACWTRSRRTGRFG